MSKIGNKPIKIPDGVKVNLNDKIVEIIGPKGNLKVNIFDGLAVEVKDGLIYVKRSSDELKKFHGTLRAKINNAIIGVTEGFSKVLEIVGVGYKVEENKTNKTLSFTVGYSHPVIIDIPPGINVNIDSKNNLLTISGIDKELVGQFAARIRMIKPPEVYKGTGIKYQGERILRKAGKAQAGAKK